MAQYFDERFGNNSGYYLVSATEKQVPIPKDKPKRLIIILVDGLRFDEAKKLNSIKKFKCSIIDVSPLSMSRPVYTTLSTGVEQDRTGVRNNANELPKNGIAIESIWEVARKNNLEVSLISELTWWKELFPNGFADYKTLPIDKNYFENIELKDITLIHPLYIDEDSHSYGLNSSQYTDSVKRLNLELDKFIDKIDIVNDLIIFTADHGHVLVGGHGGWEEGLTKVPACFLGKGVNLQKENTILSVRLLSPIISIVMGIPIPKNARIDENEIEEIFNLLDEKVYGKEYISNRKSNLEKFSSDIIAALGENWTQLYSRQTAVNYTKFIALLFLFSFLNFKLNHYTNVSYTYKNYIYIFLFLFILVTTYIFLRGNFSITSVNTREKFLSFYFPFTAIMIFSGNLINYLVNRSLQTILMNSFLLSQILFIILSTHLFAFGIRIGFPLPLPELLFLPLFSSILGIFNSIFYLIVLLIEVATAKFFK
ncbi:MAG: hypothetical protein SFU98_18470 [Leptospiraceae bacterium]|nr:hypothetical protein [Leptospiraceae bacterium]